jgi:hypothetical protein
MHIRTGLDAADAIRYIDATSPNLAECLAKVECVSERGEARGASWWRGIGWSIGLVAEGTNVNKCEEPRDERQIMSPTSSTYVHHLKSFEDST